MAQTALITGAAKRIGREIALHLAKSGWNVAIHYNTSSKEAKELISEFKKYFPKQNFAAFRANLDRLSDVEKLIPSVLGKMENIDLLVNNASLFEPSKLVDTSVKLLDTSMRINFIAPLILIRDFAKHCSTGEIINFVDTRIVSNHSDHAVYSLSKKALWELTKMVALEMGPDIRANAIAPGLTLPPKDKDDDYLWSLAENVPMKRPGGMEPILRSLDYILSNDYLTGQILFCDGGENLGVDKT